MFTAKELLGELFQLNQHTRYSGAGAAHVSGCAERGTQTVVSTAQTLVLRAALHSPAGTVTADLRPVAVAVDHAVWLCNRRVPRVETGFPPLETWEWTTHTQHSDTLGSCRVRGAPAYVLEPKLQKGGVKTLKWKPRAVERDCALGFLECVLV